MLKYLAIIDYCNNAHDDYDDDGYHIFRYFLKGALKVLVDDEEITYEYVGHKPDGTEHWINGGAVESVKQLRSLHVDGWDIVRQWHAEQGT